MGLACSSSWIASFFEGNSQMIEFMRSGAIVLMGLVVFGAGVVVVFYG